MRKITDSEQLLMEKLSLMQMDNVMVSRFAGCSLSASGPVPRQAAEKAQWRPQGISGFNPV